MGYTHTNMIASFAITAIWDVVLRQFSERRIRFMGIEDWKWVAVLKPYFEKHTPLAAALIAGLVGAIAYVLISSFTFSDNLSFVSYMIWVTFVSAVVGLPMRYSGLFPHLMEHYYKPLGFLYSMATDAFSGIVVCITMLVLGRLKDETKKN